MDVIRQHSFFLKLVFYIFSSSLIVSIDGVRPVYLKHSNISDTASIHSNQSRAETNVLILPTARQCPGCLGGSCATTTMISGLPIVQLIVATAAGFIAAAIFIWLYASFYEGGTLRGQRSVGGIGSYFSTWSGNGRTAKGQALKGENRHLPGVFEDYTESGKQLISTWNQVINAIHFFGENFM